MVLSVCNALQGDFKGTGGGGSTFFHHSYLPMWELLSRSRRFFGQMVPLSIIYEITVFSKSHPIGILQENDSHS